jgi:hypothetical protein
LLSISVLQVPQVENGLMKEVVKMKQWVLAAVMLVLATLLLEA